MVRGNVRRAVALTIFVMSFQAAVAVAAESDLRVAAPGQVGMSAERLERITALARRYVDDGMLAGMVTLVARHGQVVHFEATGVRDLETGAPMEHDTLFRIYSMSKPITAVAAMMLYEQGKFQLTDPVSKFLPELANLKVLEDGELVEPSTPMTMHHLLTHTAGFSYGFDPRNQVDRLYGERQLLQSRDLDEFITRLADIPLLFHPGSRYHYSVAVDVTGAVVERLSGQRFDEFLRTQLFAPLGMHDTFFDVPQQKRSRLGTNHRHDGERLHVLPTPNYPLWENTTFFSGGGGLVSTAADYMRFAEMLRNGGALNGVQILSPKTVEYMTMDHLPATVSATGTGESLGIGGTGGSGFGLGFGVSRDPVRSAVLGSPGEYSWGGAAGTVFWVDPVEQLVVVGMVQLMGSRLPLRNELKVLSNQAIVDLNR
jgi:CubicO group peptidase (beta-lactamase class C family)